MSHIYSVFHIIFKSPNVHNQPFESSQSNIPTSYHLISNLHKFIKSYYLHQICNLRDHMSRHPIIQNNALQTPNSLFTLTL